MPDFTDALDDAMAKVRKILPVIERADEIMDELTGIHLSVGPDEEPDDGEDTET